MKVSAANQSLILASDGPSVGKPPASANQASRLTSGRASSATGLQRLTVVAELPDSTVVTVHADYRNRDNSADRVVSSQTPLAVATTGTNTTATTSASASSLIQLSSPAYNSLLRDSDNSRDTAGNPHSSNEHVALYARTERTPGAARSSSLVDVHA